MNRQRFHVAVLAVDRVNDALGSDGRRPQFAPRNYTAESIDSLMSTAGLDLFPERHAGVTVYDSGSSSLDYLEPVRARWPRVAIRTAGRRLNLLQNFRRALEDAASKAEYVCLMEDDVAFRPLAMAAVDQWLERLGSRDFGCATLWPLVGSMADGEQVIDPATYWGNYFVIFSAATVPGMLAHPVCRQWQNTVTPDLMIGEWARVSGREIVVHPGALVQHTGAYSSLGDRDERVSSSFDVSFPAVPVANGALPAAIRGSAPGPLFASLFPDARVQAIGRWRLAQDGDRLLVAQGAGRGFRLNASAAVILGLCRQPVDFTAIVEHLLEIYPGEVTPADAGESVSATLLEFLDRKLVRLRYRDEMKDGSESLVYP